MARTKQSISSNNISHPPNSALIIKVLEKQKQSKNTQHY